jgi:hypothetical protein
MAMAQLSEVRLGVAVEAEISTISESPTDYGHIPSDFVTGASDVTVARRETRASRQH